MVDILCFLSNFMRTECLSSRYVFDMALPLSRLVSAVGDSILHYSFCPSLPPVLHIFLACQNVSSIAVAVEEGEVWYR